MTGHVRDLLRSLVRENRTQGSTRGHLVTGAYTLIGRKLRGMPRTKIQFTAATVQCTEAIDWEIVQVSFDTMDSSFGEENRTTPYLLISANFEFSERVQIEYHDGNEYAGDSLNRIDLWRNRIFAISGLGYEFDIAYELSDEAFAELREYLKVLQRSDCFRG